MIQTGSKVAQGNYRVVALDAQAAAGAVIDILRDAGAQHVAIASVEALAAGELF